MCLVGVVSSIAVVVCRTLSNRRRSRLADGEGQARVHCGCEGQAVEGTRGENKVAQTKSLVEAIGVDEVNNQVVTPPSKQSDARALKKCLLDNMRGWTEVLTHMTFVDGLNLVDTIQRDRERARTDLDFKMGRFYYLL